MDGWISIRERMPDHTDEVLIHGEWGTLIGNRNSTGGWIVEGFVRPDSWVTHWQELPPPPQNIRTELTRIREV